MLKAQGQASMWKMQKNCIKMDWLHWHWVDIYLQFASLKPTRPKYVSVNRASKGRKIPKNSEKFRKIPENSRRFRRLERPWKGLQILKILKIPKRTSKNSKKFRKIPKNSEKFRIFRAQKIPKNIINSYKGIICLEKACKANIPKNSEKFRKIPNFSRPKKYQKF